MIDTTEVARKILNIFDQMHESRRPQTIPTQRALSRVLEEVFWSSVDDYEGNPLRARIFFASRPVPSPGIIQLFPRPVSRKSIRQLAPAHTPDGGLVVVEGADGEPQIEAILGSSPYVRRSVGNSPSWLCVESRGPAALRVSIVWGTILEFARGELKHLGGTLLDRDAAKCRLMSAGLFPTEPGRDWHISSLLLDIGEAIDHHGLGGAIWILPPRAAMDGDLEGKGQRVAMSPIWWEPFAEMEQHRTSKDRLLNSPWVKEQPCSEELDILQEAAQQLDHLRQDAVTRSLASLTKTDGAVVMNGTPQVLAFGVICNTFSHPAERVLELTDPSRPAIAVKAEVFGGSRHRSAIDFCSSHSPAGAVVASHDGGLTVFTSSEKGCVIGSRVSLIPSDAEVKRE